MFAGTPAVGGASGDLSGQAASKKKDEDGIRREVNLMMGKLDANPEVLQELNAELNLVDEHRGEAEGETT